MKFQLAKTFAYKALTGACLLACSVLSHQVYANVPNGGAFLTKVLYDTIPSDTLTDDSTLSDANKALLERYRDDTSALSTPLNEYTNTEITDDVDYDDLAQLATNTQKEVTTFLTRTLPPYRDFLDTVSPKGYDFVSDEATKVFNELDKDREKFLKLDKSGDGIEKALKKIMKKLKKEDLGDEEIEKDLKFLTKGLAKIFKKVESLGTKAASIAGEDNDYKEMVKEAKKDITKWQEKYYNPYADHGDGDLREDVSNVTEFKKAKKQLSIVIAEFSLKLKTGTSAIDQAVNPL